MKIIWIYLLIIVSGYTLFEKKCYEDISSQDFYMLLETEDVILIDVRTYMEYKNERIEGASIASDKKALKLLLAGYEKDISVLVYCTTGIRSKKAASYICNDLGFNNVYNLEDGIVKWKRKSYPIDETKLE